MTGFREHSTPSQLNNFRILHAWILQYARIQKRTIDFTVVHRLLMSIDKNRLMENPSQEPISPALLQCIRKERTDMKRHLIAISDQHNKAHFTKPIRDATLRTQAIFHPEAQRV